MGLLYTVYYNIKSADYTKNNKFEENVEKTLNKKDN